MKPESLGQLLEAWLDRLNAEGFSVGVRERLAAYRLLVHVSLDVGPADRPGIRSPRESLELIGPLLCTSPESQRRYASLLNDFAGAAPRRTRIGRVRAAVSLRRETPGRVAALLGLASLLLAALWLGSSQLEDGKPKGVQFPAKTDDADPDLFEEGSAAELPYVVPLPLSLGFATEAAAPPLDRRGQWTILAFACAGFLGLGAWSLLRQRSQRAALTHARTDRELSERLLTTEVASDVPPHQPLLRGAARVLRQRVAGRRLEFDLAATTTASIRAAGAFAPRFRSSQTTPEYLVLVERSSRNDHYAAIADRMVAALRDRDVTLHVYSHDGSPGRGCWRPRRSDADRRPPERFSFAELAARHDGCRLIAFGNAEAVIDPLTGEALPWTREVRSFPGRAWLSPMPMSAWGAAESVADALGFLVLPTQWEAIPTVADWFSAESLLLREGSWPSRYPELLRNDGLSWLVRSTRPADGELNELLAQLGDYLGTRSFQWMCACATFPALSPALTEEFGRLVIPDHADRAVGQAALSSLPWFRVGGMQNWLRSELIRLLRPDLVNACRELIARRLDTALVDRPGQALASVFVERGVDARGWQRISAWLDKRSPMARDALLVRLFRNDQIDQLAQELPRRLQQAVLGGQFGVLLRQHWRLLGQTVLLAIVTIIAWFATAPARPLQPSQGDPTPSAVFGEPGLTCAAFRPDGALIVSGHVDGTIRRWTRGGTAIEGNVGQDGAPIEDLLWSSDGLRLVTLNLRGEVRVWDVATGKQRLAYTATATSRRLQPHEEQGILVIESSGTIQRIKNPVGTYDWEVGTQPDSASPPNFGGLTAIDFTYGGQFSVRGYEHGGVDFSAPGDEDLRFPNAHPTKVARIVASQSSELVASAGIDGSLLLWDPTGTSMRATPLEGHTARIWSLAFHPSGSPLCSASDDHTARIWYGMGASTSILKHGPAFVEDARFSPDGSQVLTRADDGVLRLWGASPPVRIEILGCDSSLAGSRAGEVARAIINGHREEPEATGATAFAQSPSSSPALIDASVVAFPIDVWQRLHSGQPVPPIGDIVFNQNDPAQVKAAEKLASLLQSGALERSLTEVRWRLVAAPQSQDAIVVNVCPGSREGTEPYPNSDEPKQGPPQARPKA